MPMYDIECPSHGRINDIFFSLSDEPACPTCDAPSRIVIAPVRTVGPMPSKPLKIKQLGKEFTSNSQWREYKEAHPDVQILDKNDASYQEFYTEVHEKADKVAQKMGYADHKDRGQKRKAEKMKEPSLTHQK